MKMGKNGRKIKMLLRNFKNNKMEKQFKFKLGAFVTHITEASAHNRFIVISRGWIESIYGISRGTALHDGYIRRTQCQGNELQLVVEAKK